MIKEYLYFSIGFEDVDWGNEEDQNKRYDFIKNFTEPFNIKCGFAGNGSFSLDMPNINDFLDKLKEYSDSKSIKFNDNCAYVQVYDGFSDWYEYLPSKSIEGTWYDDNCIMTCNAANIPVNINIGCGFGAYPFVSDKFIKVVEDNKLTGLEFLWSKDVGKFAPLKQWFMAIATEFIGRGLDAPWIDTNSIYLSESEELHNQLGRIGITTRFPAKALKKDAPLPPTLVKYLMMCNIDNFNISYHKRFLREFLPNTDFAFGYFPGFQGLYISKKAREILLHSRLIMEDEIKPVVILDKLPAGETQHDSYSSMPAFYYGDKRFISDNLTFEELKELHRKVRDNYNEKTKPLKKFTLKQALSLINKEKRIRPNAFVKGIKEENLKTLNITIPFDWIEILKKTNGGYLSLDCLLVPLEEIAILTEEKQKQGKNFYEDYPQNRISVAIMGDGDWYDLVINDDCHVECRVVQVTHEGGGILREWDSVSNFIYEMILENEH